MFNWGLLLRAIIITISIVAYSQNSNVNAGDSSIKDNSSLVKDN